MKPSEYVGNPRLSDEIQENRFEPRMDDEQFKKIDQKPSWMTGSSRKSNRTQENRLRTKTLASILEESDRTQENIEETMHSWTLREVDGEKLSQFEEID